MGPTSTPSSWTVRDNPDRRRFEIDLGDSLAIAEYTLPKGMIMFTHTARRCACACLAADGEISVDQGEGGSRHA